MFWCLCWIEMSWNGRGMGLVWNSSFGSISHTTFYRSKELVLVFNSTPVLFILSFLTTWTKKLLITCRVIKVIQLYICFRVSYLRSSIYSFVLYILSLYIWHVNFYRMLHCLCSGLVELIVFVQAQHINNRKYRNSYTINDECR